MTMIGIALLFLLTVTCAQPWQDWALTPRCSDVHFKLTTTAANRVANNPPKDLFSNPEAIDAFLGQPVVYRNVSGTFIIYGQLCRPLHHSRIPKLQLLVHGSTYNHTYWSALQEPSGSASASSLPDHEELSWVDAATRRGYWTLAIDRLGQGLSSRPDPVTIVQDPLQTQLLHLIVREIREHDLLGIRFGSEGHGVDKLKLIYVGHSFGSGLGVHLAAAHPEDLDGIVLTGIGVGGPGTRVLRLLWVGREMALGLRRWGVVRIRRPVRLLLLRRVGSKRGEAGGKATPLVGEHRSTQHHGTGRWPARNLIGRRTGHKASAVAQLRLRRCVSVSRGRFVRYLSSVAYNGLPLFHLRSSTQYANHGKTQPA
ncbi:hypothetical protein CHU98_g8191 [Xylaria longipes]|nr:hypothetical protein CHU98_g8191 [Xylaria longipes]